MINYHYFTKKSRFFNQHYEKDKYNIIKKLKILIH